MEINGEPVVLTAANNFQQNIKAGVVNTTVHKYREGVGQTVHMTTNLYNLLVYATPKQWDAAAQEVTRYSI